MHLEIPKTFPVTAHTDHVGVGSTFVAIKGAKQDGIVHIPRAVAQGASTVVIHDDVALAPEVIQLLEEKSVALLRVPNTRRALAQLSAKALNYPATKLKIFGITGTKGKTTTSFILEHLLKTAGYKTALLSTVRNRILDQEFTTALTTQQPDYLHVFLDLCVRAGVTHLVMEVSAQALSLHRLEGIAFDGVVFTNFSQEHAEFYATQKDYFSAKQLIFSAVKSGSPVFINGDDAFGNQLLQQHGTFLSFGVQHEGAVVRGSLSNQLTQQGLSFDLSFKKEVIRLQSSSLLGFYNVYNILGAAALALKCGVASELVARGIATFTQVPGRMERHQLPRGATCIIDYAHTPSSFQALLSTLRPMTDHLVVVFGCGGDRDSIKRPVMGRLAAEIADVVVVTSDNPRSENLVTILDQIESGIVLEHKNKVTRVLDREEAIKRACSLARKGTIVALLGKGPDEYEEVAGKKRYFSERAIIAAL